MNTACKIYLIIFVCLGFIASPAFARLGWFPDFDELSKKCDVIVIAEPIGVKDLSESSTLPNIRPAIKVIGVETTFKVVTVLKGEIKSSEFILHHYRLPLPKEIMKMDSGPGLVSFPFEYEKYIMFLNKEDDGRYCPGSGQIDPNLSIRPIADNMWFFDRGWIFVPATNNFTLWVLLTILVLILILLNIAVYIKLIKKDASKSHPTEMNPASGNWNKVLSVSGIDIKGKHVNYALFGTSIACMICYLAFCIYIILVYRFVFEWNANPVKNGFGPLGCGTDIRVTLNLIFNLLLPLHLAASIGLIIQFFRKKLKGIFCFFLIILFAMSCVYMGAIGSWLYANYLGIYCFGECIWWIWQ